METTIHATEELPTIHDESKGTVWKQHHKHKEFYLVLIHNIGEAFYFHENQLKPINKEQSNV